MDKKYQDILIKLMNSSVKRYLFKEEYEILYIQVVGSILTGLSSELSDIDMIAICKNSPINEESPIALEYEGVHIHWHFINYRAFFFYTFEFGIRSSYMHQLHWLTPEFCVFVHPDFQNNLNFLLLEKDKFIKPCLMRFLYCQRNYLKELVRDGLIPSNSGKMIYHFLSCYSILEDEELDYNLTQKIKRICHQWPSEKALDYAYERVQKLISYIPSEEEFQKIQKDIDDCQNIFNKLYEEKDI